MEGEQELHSATASSIDISNGETGLLNVCSCKCLAYVNYVTLAHYSHVVEQVLSCG